MTADPAAEAAADTDPADRLADPAAEAALVGGIMLAGHVPPDVEIAIGPADFATPAAGLVYEACLALAAAGRPIDPVTVADELGNAARRVGGPVRLVELTETPAPGSVAYYAAIVARLAALRRYAAAGSRIAAFASSRDADPGEVAERARHAVDEAAGAPPASSMAEVYERVIDAADSGSASALPGLRTGFYDLDGILNPLRPGKLVLVGARPGVGKSVLCTDLARHAAYVGQAPVLFVSLEMDTDELVARTLAAECAVPLEAFERGTGWPVGGWDRVAAARTAVVDGPLHIEYAPGATLAQLRGLVRQHRPALVVVDYLQQMSTGQAERRDLAVAELSRGLKLLAQRESTCIVAASQLNRAGEMRADKRPSLADLRESGALEADADVVLLLHRPELSDRDSDRPGELDVTVAKQRSGPAGLTAVLGSQLHLSRFVSLAPSGSMVLR